MIRIVLIAKEESHSYPRLTFDQNGWHSDSGKIITTTLPLGKVISAKISRVRSTDVQIFKDGLSAAEQQNYSGLQSRS